LKQKRKGKIERYYKKRDLQHQKKLPIVV